MHGPEEFVSIWLLLSIFAGWIGSIWTLGTLWKFRKRLGGWRLCGISLLGAPALGLIATLLLASLFNAPAQVNALNFDQTFWGLVAVGMAAVYQTAYSLGAYHVFRKRDVATD